MTPELSFFEDNSIAYGAHISKILSGIEISKEDEETDESSED